MEKIKEIWALLPKTAKVFLYIAFSVLLAELAIELGNFEQTFFVRFLAQVINLALVFLQEAVPAIKERLK